MADEPKFPYLVTPGNLTNTVKKFRSSLPTAINTSTLKRLQLAPSNEKQVIDVLKHIGMVGEGDKPTPRATDIFNTVADDAFQKKLAEAITESYGNLFELHREAMWSLSEQELVGYFREVNQTTDSTGKRQALAFTTLAAIAGKRAETIVSKASSSSPKPRRETKKPVGGRSSGTKKDSDREEDGFKAKLDGNLQVNIQIHIAADTSPENIALIFEKMGKYLFNNNT